MTIYINNKAEQTDAATVAALLAEKNISAQGTAVALNGKLVPLSRWESQALADADKLTIISAAYGG